MKKIIPGLSLLTLFLVITCRAVAQDNGAQDGTQEQEVSTQTTPPELPDSEQPACPAEGYLWQPGYWAFDAANGYYWVPGVWTAPPAPDVLWTPPYWAFLDGMYVFHGGYWGPTVGYYGGINYGYGYGGAGYVGGIWVGHTFRYNTAVVNVNTVVITHTYVNRTVVVNNVVVNHVSFNGRGGVLVRPRAEELAAMHEHHYFQTREQIAHVEAARMDRNQFARVNNGHPNAVAMDRVGGNPVHEGPRQVVNRPGNTAFSPNANAGNHPNTTLTHLSHPAGEPNQLKNTTMHVGTPVRPGGGAAPNRLQSSISSNPNSTAVNTPLTHTPATPLNHSPTPTLNHSPATTLSRSPIATQPLTSPARQLPALPSSYTSRTTPASQQTPNTSSPSPSRQTSSSSNPSSGSSPAGYSPARSTSSPSSSGSTPNYSSSSRSSSPSSTPSPSRSSSPAPAPRPAPAPSRPKK